MIVPSKKRKYIEYRCYLGTDINKDPDVNHVSWQEAKRLIKSPPDDLLLIERVTRLWELADESMLDEETETIYEKMEE